MPIQIPSNAYSGGAVALNSQPEVNLYGQVLARHQAKMDALDQYERNRINSVNDAGMRDKDRKSLDEKLGEIKSYYNQNKDKIRKGVSEESLNYEKKFREAKDLISGSKERNARHEAGMKFYNEKLKLDQRVPEDFVHEMDANDRAIGETYVDPTTGEKKEYAPLDLTKWAADPKPFVADKFLKSFADIKRTPGAPRYEGITGNPLKLNEVTDEVFDNGAKQVIAARAADKYDNSYSFASQVQEEAKDPVRRKQLGDLFKQEYGMEPSMPSDYAVAYTMEMLQPKTSKSKTVDNKEEITKRSQNFQLRKLAIQDAYIKGRAKLNQEKPGLGDYDRLGAYTGKMKEVKVNIPTAVEGFTEEKTATIVPANEVTVSDKKMMGEVEPYTDPKNGLKYYVVKEDGDWEGKKGQVISAADVARANMDRTSLSEVKRNALEMKTNQGTGTKAPAQRPGAKSFKIIDPDTGKVVGTVGSQEEADKATKKGYKVQ